MVPAVSDAKKLDQAHELTKAEPGRAEAIYKDVLSKDPENSDAGLRNYEIALMGLGELYRDQQYVP